MEEWIPIVLSALYVAAMTALAVTAKKRKLAAARNRQQQAQQQQQQPPQTAAPVAPQRAAKPASRALRPAPRTTRPAPSTSFAEEYATLPEVRAAQHSPKPQPEAVNPAATPVTPETGEIGRDFDLRQAILYSEILKPKFDSEEGF